MLPASVAVVPETSAATLAFALSGVALGAVSGLTPGVHANNFALLLASLAPALPASPALVGVAILAAGVVHTFLDVVPALALGVPDAAMAASALPGHELVLAGRGREALRLSALGSGAAVLLAAPLAVPMTRAMTAVYPALRASLPAVLAAVAALLVASEPTPRRALVGALSFALSALLGLATLDSSPSAPLSIGGVLAPLFAGLFGAPVLLDAYRGGGVPPQEDPSVTMPRRDLASTALAGSTAGAVVGYVPGVSAAVAATLSLPAVPGRTGARGFLVATSGANTATTVFALFALVSLGTPRTGVMVALSEAEVPLVLPTLLATVALSAAVGCVLVVVVGDRYLTTVGRVDPRVLSAVTLCLLAVVSYLFAGVVGVGVFAAAAAVGLVPPRLGARRVHLMGVLVGPLALGA